MMNSTTNDDEFGDNPFRSAPAASGGDMFFDATPQPDPLQQQQQFGQPQQFQQQQQQFQQPQPEIFAPPQNNFALPAGPMDSMAPQQQMQPQIGNMQAQQPRSWWANCMMCLTMDSYRAYFDIEADDIVNRMKGVFLHFYKPEYFRNNVLGVQKTDVFKGPDLYGPFWVTMTLIFLIGVSNRI
jgi:hypothetical protein